MLHSPNKSQFYQEYRNEIQAYEIAARWLKEHYTQETFPSLKSLKDEKEKLLLKKEQQLELYQYFKDYKSELQIVR